MREGFASREAVRECLEIQNKLKSYGVEPKRLGEIMVEKGYLRDEDVKGILDVQKMGGSRLESRSGITELKSKRLKAQRARAAKAPRVKDIPGYEVLELLGEGGMGMVYKARQKSLDRIVALKVLPPSAAREASFIKRFISEARTVARLNHENIIAGIDVGEAGGTYYFAMEHVEGDSVADLIEAQGPLEERFALQVAAQMARALQHAHKHGLVHRDVKPQNILVTRSNLAKLCDLGLAKLQSEKGADPTGVPVGTPHYLSPEQARGEADVDIRSDIYSLGATLYHMLTGHTPFEGQSPMVLMTKHLTEDPVPPRRRNPSVSKAASDLVLAMMAKDKEDRHQTPEELLEDIERVLAGKRPAGGSAGSRRGPRRGGASRRGSRRQSGEAPAARGAGGGRPRRAHERSRARRGHMIRSGKGYESMWLVIIPLMIIAVISSVVYMAYHRPDFREGTGGTTGPTLDEAAQREAQDTLSRARSLERTDPEQARALYRSVAERYRGTVYGRMATDYLRELGR